MNNCGTIILEVPHSHSADLLCNDTVQHAELCLPLLRQNPADHEQGRSYTPGEADFKKGLFGTAQLLQSLLSDLLPKPFLASAWKESPMLYPGTEARFSQNVWVGVPQSLQVLWAGWAGSKTGCKRNNELYITFVSPDYASKSGSNGFVWLLA